MVQEIRDIENSLIYKSQRDLSQGEMMNRENLFKSLAAKNDLKKGTIIKLNDLIVKSPGIGISPLEINTLLENL